MTSSAHRQFQHEAVVRKALNSSCVPLEPAVRGLMEARFGQDFGDVRLHVGDAAAASARAMNAKAYTVGSHIIFSAGSYNPGKREGLWLLAHELAHVVQRRRGSSISPLQANDISSLEYAANDAADLVATGLPVSPDFAFGHAPAGAVLCHTDIPCPGTPISAQDPLIYKPANQAIEEAYREAPENRGHADAILVGSQFDRGEILLPRGAPNKRFGDHLLGKLRGIRNQRRPDIIDFVRRIIFEIKPAGRAAQGTVQLESYYVLTEEIREAYPEFDEPPWKVEYAVWYPPHVLPFPSDPLQKIVCTQATDHKRWPGLILYDVRAWQRRQRQQRVNEYRLEEFEPQYVELAPMIRAQLPKRIPYFQPLSPDYVLIVPQEFFTLDYVKQKTAKQWDQLRVKLPYFIDTKQEMVVAKYISWMIIGIAVGAFAGGVLIAAAPAIEAGAAVTITTTATAGASAEAGAGAIPVVIAYEAGGASALSSTIVAPEAIAARLASGGATLALRAMMSAPAVKAVAAAAGALVVLGNVRGAWAASGAAPVLENVVAVKSVAMDDFQPIGGTQVAFSDRPPTQCFNTPKERFRLGTKVMYDQKPHWVIGRFSVR